MPTGRSDKVHHLSTWHITHRIYRPGNQRMTHAEIGAELLISPGPGRYPLAENSRFTICVDETGDWHIEYKRSADPD